MDLKTKVFSGLLTGWMVISPLINYVQAENSRNPTEFTKTCNQDLGYYALEIEIEEKKKEVCLNLYGSSRRNFLEGRTSSFSYTIGDFTVRITGDKYEINGFDIINDKEYIRRLDNLTKKVLDAAKEKIHEDIERIKKDAEKDLFD